MATKLKRGTLERLSRNENSTVNYQNAAGEEMVGTLRHVPHVPWIVTAEIPAASAYREVRRFRNIALSIVVALLAVVSVIAYWLGLILVRPLDRLTTGAAEVAAGDLAVDLPPGGGGEVGYLTYVFNHMVSRLRESRKELDASNATLRKQNEELERLSTTDGLTALANRRQLNRRLTEEVLRARRSKQPFAVLMADVDHFKSYNDTLGHPAGDDVLKRVAQILRDCTREVDLVARYGGEEFCILLPETSGEMALPVAERIRSRMAVEKFPGRQITLSLGIAEFARNGDTPEAVLAAADAALYQSKRTGRDRVIKAK
jgi:diguanylate cyclase (GGDEF)-like protein